MLRWLQQHEPENIARVHQLCMAKDYLRLRLTGEWATDFGDVIGALMGDIETRTWSPEICALIGWPADTLPPLKNAADKGGEISTKAAEDTGLKVGTPVMVGSIDTSVELLGAGVVDEGQAAIKLATAGVLSLVVDKPVSQPPISCYPHLLADRYYVAAGTNSCASALHWAREQLIFPQDVDDEGTPHNGFKAMDELAAGVAPGSDGLIFHPYLQGERAPYWDPDLRADFIGLTMRHTRAHIARAVYEGIAYSIRDLLRDATQKGFQFDSARLIGGGASSVTWRQIMADITGLTLQIPAQSDASFGSALLAGIGIGEFKDAAEVIDRCVRIVDQVKSDASTRDIYATLFEFYRRTQQVLAPINHELAKLNR
jgi:xylulokinase